MIVSEDAELGTRSMFGSQALSTRESLPSPSFTKGGRTRKLAGAAFESQQQGRESPGPAYDVGAGLGKQQVLSRCATSPAVTISRRDPAPRLGGSVPGPGTYKTDYSTVGHVVPVARLKTAAATRIGKAKRFDERAQPKGWSSEPALTDPRPTAGYLGDAPRWTFHGGKARAHAPLGAGLGAASAPSYLQTPAPGSYAGAARSAFGAQVSSEAATAPAAKLPKARRDAVLKQALSKAEEQALLCATTAGPCLGQASSLGRQVLSSRRSTGACSFGSSGRFSDRPRARAAVARRSVGQGSGGGEEEGGGGGGGGGRKGWRADQGDEVPGPGAYLV